MQDTHLELENTRLNARFAWLKPHPNAVQWNC